MLEEGLEFKSLGGYSRASLDVPIGLGPVTRADDCCNQSYCKVTNDTHKESYNNNKTRDKNGRENNRLYYSITHVGSYNKLNQVSIWINNLYIHLQNSYSNYLSVQPINMTYEVDLI